MKNLQLEVEVNGPRTIGILNDFLINLIIQIWRKLIPGRKVTQPSQLQRALDDPFARAKGARACSGCLAFAELTRLGEHKCLYGEKFAQQGE